MKYNKLMKLILIIILVFSTISVAGEISEKAENSVYQKFGKSVHIEIVKLKIPDNIKKRIEKAAKQRFFRNYVYLYKIFKNDTTVGYAILDNVIGKVMQITFMVFFDTNGKITNTEILKYREQYGGAIKNPKWTGQFVGKDYNSGFVPGKDIDGISGATISVNSVSKGIRKLTLLYKEIIGIK